MTQRAKNISMVVLTLTLLALLMSGCKSHVKYIEVERIQHDTVSIAKYMRDSIYLHDSIYHEVTTKHDTVFDVMDRWHVAYKDRIVHDSVYISKNDTIPIAYTVEIERTKTFWEKMKDKTWFILLALAVVEALTIFCIWKVWR